MLNTLLLIFTVVLVKTAAYPTTTTTSSPTPWYPYQTTSPYYPTYPTTTGSYPWYTTTGSYPTYPTTTRSYPTYPTTTGSYPWYTSTTGPYPWDTTTRSYPTYPTTTGSYPWYTTTTAQYSTETSPKPAEDRGSFAITLDSFTTVLIPAATNVTVRNSYSEHSVLFDCPRSILPHVSTNLIKKVLMINSPTQCNLEITAEEFQVIRLGYVEELRAGYGLSGNKLMVETDNTTFISLHGLVYQSLGFKFPSSSRGNIQVGGSTKTLDIFQEGFTMFDARYLTTESASIFANNSGAINVKASNYISIRAERNANIRWCAPHGDIKIQGDISATGATVNLDCY